MRNTLAHDYPEDPAIQTASLNKAFELAEELSEVLDVVTRFALPYLGSDGDSDA